MAKKSNIHSEDITEKDILSLHEGVLPLLYNTPKKLDPINGLRKGIAKFVTFDSFHYLMLLSSPEQPHQADKFRLQFDKYEEIGLKDNFSLKLINNYNREESFAELIAKGHQKMVEDGKTQHPDKPFCHFYRILSPKNPKVMIGFLRFGKSAADNVFSENEIHIFEKLAPHIQILMRLVLLPIFNKPKNDLFDTYARICSAITANHGLSDTESKFLPDILLGRTNEEMADHYFVTVATIKKHLKHILKKTKAKNRVDFISKFFTSPERVSL